MRSQNKLLKELEELEEKCNVLQNEIDYYIDYNNQMFEELEKLRKSTAEKKRNYINDIDDFKFKLMINNLLSDELNKFIDDYLKWGDIDAKN